MEQIEIRRNVRVALAIAVVALVFGALFVARGHAWIVLGVLLVALAGFYGWVAYDGRVPLLLLDEQGVRARTGSTWRGIPWSHIREVEHTPVARGVRGWWRDGALRVMPHDEEPFGVALGLATTTTGVTDGDLSAGVAMLAPDGVAVVEIDESLDPADTGSLAPVAAESAESAEIGATGTDEAPATDTNPRLERVEPGSAPEPAPEPTVASPTPAALRDVTQVVRVDVELDRRTDDDTAQALAQGALALSPDSLDDTGSFRLPEESELRRTPDEERVVPAHDPVIGPELAAARERLALSVDSLAQRTRIRPHVIEAMEVDDFVPCGGDFYARGHLRTLARVLGLDAAPLLATYDATYADAPVDPRAVFRAELAQTDSSALRRLKGGPNWSVLVAAVMAVVLVWSVARLLTAGNTAPKAHQGMALQSSTYVKDPYAKVAAPVPVTLDAAGGGAHVIVRDASSAVVFSGDLAFNESKTLQVSPPLRIQTSDGSLAVSVAGSPATAIGRTGHPAQHTYIAH